MSVSTSFRLDPLSPLSSLLTIGRLLGNFPLSLKDGAGARRLAHPRWRFLAHLVAFGVVEPAAALALFVSSGMEVAEITDYNLTALGFTKVGFVG